ncbi:MAG: trigger factor [Planctomycetota bacterium]
MSVSVKEVGPCKKEILVSIGADELAKTYDKCLKEIASSVSLPGFRRGHVPLKLLEKRFEKEIEHEVKNQTISDAYTKALEDNKLSALSEPHIDSVDYDRAKGISFTATVEVRPEFKLEKYKGLEITAPKPTVEDKDVDAAIDELRHSRGSLVEREGKSEEGDHLTATCEFFEGDKSVLKREHVHLHSGHDHLEDIHLDGLGKKIVGVAQGAEIKWKAKVDDHFPVESCHGKTLDVVLKVEEVKAVKLPDLDGAFSSSLGFETVEALKAKVRSNLEIQKKAEIDEQAGEDLLNLIADGVDFPLPEELLRRQSFNLLRQTDAVHRVAAAPEDERHGLVESELATLREPAGVQVRNYFILEEIAKLEKIFVTERDMALHVSQMAAARGMSPEELMKALKEGGALSEIRLGIRERKTVKWLLDNSKIAEGPRKEIKPKAIPAAPAGSKKASKPKASEPHVHGPDCDHDHDHKEKPAAKDKPAKAAPAKDTAKKKPATKKTGGK